MAANRLLQWTLSILLAAAAPAIATPLAIDFESIPLGASGFDNGATAGGEFTVEGATFNNEFLPQFNAWSGWSFSRTTDTTTPGFVNQYSAYANLPSGGGAEGSDQYAVAYSGADIGAGARPVIDLPEGALPLSVEITNTTYAALSIQNGDSFARQFTNGDFFRLTIEAVDSQQQSLASIDVFLADYRNGSELLIDDWTEIDLTPLQADGVTALEFHFESTDTGLFGINTPVYVAIDNLTLDTPTAIDANNDGLVNTADYVALRDTVNDPETLAAWRAAFGSGGAPVAAVAVPEPSAAWPTLAAVATVFARRRRNQHQPGSSFLVSLE